MIGSMSAFTRVPAAEGGACTEHEIRESLARCRLSKANAPVPVPPPQHQESPWATGWLLQDFMELGALPSAVPCARLHARQLLWEWSLTALSNNAELLVSELVTNAIAASQSLEQVLPVRLWLLSDRTQLLILVWDSSIQPPASVNTGKDAESGRGLLLVEAISERWDWYFPAKMDGKLVWASLGI